MSNLYCLPKRILEKLDRLRLDKTLNKCSWVECTQVDDFTITIQRGDCLNNNEEESTTWRDVEGRVIEELTV